MKKLLTNILKFLLFFGVGLTILYFVYQKQNTAYLAECALNGIAEADCNLIQKIIADFKSANYWWILVVYFCYMLSNISRALRWKMLIKPLGYRPKLINVFGAVMLGYFGNLGLPRLGEVLRAVSVSKYEDIPLEQVIGTVIVERLVDVVCLLACIGLCFLIEFDTIWGYIEQWQASKEGGSSWLLIGAALAGLSTLIIGFLFRAKLMAMPLFQKLFKIAKGFWEGIISIGQMDKPGTFIFHSVFIWLMYFLMTYFCFFAFEPTAGLPAKVALLTFVVGAIAIVVPSPGGMGTYHLFVTSLLVLYGIGDADAFSFANILFFSVQLGINVFIGIIALVVLPFINKSYKPSPVIEAT